MHLELLKLTLVFCSNVFAALEFRSNICFVISHVYSIVVLNVSKLANIKLFVVLKTVQYYLSKVLTNLLYVLATDSGNIQLLNVVLKF